jgi:hypothetical protein
VISSDHRSRSDSWTAHCPCYRKPRLLDALKTPGFTSTFPWSYFSDAQDLFIKLISLAEGPRTPLFPRTIHPRLKYGTRVTHVSPCQQRGFRNSPISGTRSKGVGHRRGCSRPKSGEGYLHNPQLVNRFGDKKAPLLNRFCFFNVPIFHEAGCGGKKATPLSHRIKLKSADLLRSRLDPHSPI